MLSFVIPCYNSEKTITFVVDEIETVVKKLQVPDYEIILVSDSSPDDVFSVITLLAQEKPYLKAIEFSKNFGQHAALLAGYRQTSGDIVVSLDDDGQIPIDELGSLLEKLGEGYDVVFGRYHQKKHSIFRNFGSLINNKMTEILLHKPKNLHTNSFWVGRKFVIEEMCRYHNAYPYILGLILRCTHNITDVEVNHRERLDGASGYTFQKLVQLWLNGFTAFSIVPLRLATLIGVLCAFSGFVAGAVVVIRKLINPAIEAGYSSTMAAQFFIGGMIMLMLGMIGEYIGRIYISINNSPQYVIRKSINFKEESETDDENQNRPKRP